jgi:type I restriction enzyme S subunit
VRLGELQDRWDVNYTSSTLQFEKDYSNPKYDLAPLRELVSFVQYGISVIATEEPIGIPMLRMNNLQNDGWDLTDLKYIELSQEELNKYKIIQGDLLFNRTNSKELVGKCEVFTEPGDWVFASYLIRVRLDLSKALPEFISAFLGTKAGRLQIDRVSRQIIGMSNVNAEELKDLLIPVPSLDIQRTLVADTESARLARQAKLSQADELLKGIDGFVLEQLGLKLPKEEARPTFAVRLGNVKQGRQDALYYAPYYEKLVSALDKCKHPKDSLGNISPELVGGATPSKGDADLYAEDGIKFLRILNVAPNEIVLDKVNYIQDSVHNGELKRSQLAANDILMTITGRVGTSAVVTEDILPANINQHIVKMRIQRADCLPEYLAVYLNSSIGMALSNRGVTGGTRIALDYEVIRKIQIPLPPLGIQKKIVSELQHRRAQARVLREEAEREWQNAKEKFERNLLEND